MDRKPADGKRADCSLFVGTKWTQKQRSSEAIVLGTIDDGEGHRSCMQSAATAYFLKGSRKGRTADTKTWRGTSSSLPGGPFLGFCLVTFRRPGVGEKCVTDFLPPWST
mmetsp:Transcript_5418/g.14396  ORF Transcript_5418/g.14396 Transcript_5418/m.14396 type:complete len:109 (+) Transcript_5418:323-649(+)